MRARFFKITYKIKGARREQTTYEKGRKKLQDTFNKIMTDKGLKEMTVVPIEQDLVPKHVLKDMEGV